MAITRRNFLRSLAAPAALPLLSWPSVASANQRPKRLIVVMCEGGWDVAYCLDPKVGVPTVHGPERDQDPNNPDDVEAVQTFSSIPVLTNDVKRPAVSEFFSAWSPKVAVVNGIWVGAIAHATARIRILNGTQLQEDPAWAVIAGSVHGRDLPLGSVDLSGGSYMGHLAPTSGQIGIQSQIKALIDDQTTFPAVPGADRTYPIFRTDDVDRSALFDHLQARNEAIRQELSAGRLDPQLMESRLEATLRADRFRNEGRDAIAGLTLGTTPSFSSQIDLAVQLLETDLCRAVTVDSGVRWDSHRDNFLQHGYYQSLFTGLTQLAETLTERGLWDDTMVVVISEMTRTPTVNSSKGKDHWPHTSFMLFGGNVLGGRVYGGTDDRLESRNVDPVTGDVDEAGELNKYNNISAGILAALDVDPEPWFPAIRPYTACFG
jgi:hypothetical protein